MRNCLLILSTIVLLIGILSFIEPTLNRKTVIPLDKLLSFLNISPNDLKSNNYLSIMSYNVRFKHLDTGKNKWENRREKLIANIKKYNPDIFSIQEDTQTQVDYIEEALLPEYNYLGLMIEAPENSQNNVIFFRRKLLRPLWRQNVYLNEKNIPFEKGWDAHDQRTATIALLEFIPEPREKIVIVNAHLDHLGKTARIESMKKIMDTLAEEFHGRHYPVFMMGDFNECPKQYVDKMVLENKFVDVYDDVVANTGFIGDYHPASFHYYLGTWADNFFVKAIFYTVYSAYNQIRTDFSRFHIDHMYYKQGDKVKVKTVYFTMPSDDVYSSKDGIYASDHFPLYAVFKLDILETNKEEENK